MEPVNTLMGSNLPKASVTRSVPSSPEMKRQLDSAAPADIKATSQDERVTGLGLEDDQKKRDDLKQAVNDVNELFQASSRSLEFNIDEDSQQMVIQIKDSETKEVIRQIPSEEVLKLAKHLDDFKGMLFQEIA